MQNKTALITGISGQDGALLAQYLLKHDYSIVAPVRHSSDLTRLKSLKIDNNKCIEFILFDKWSDFEEIINTRQPDEIYHLAAISHIGKSHKNPEVTFDVNVCWTLKILESVRKHSFHSRLFFASSSEIFQSIYNNKPVRIVNEKSIRHADNPYGISKLAAHNLIEYYRNTYQMYAASAILFNHESDLRSHNFISKKICMEAARIVKSGGDPLYLGNIDACKDWGYAPDFIPAFHNMLQLKKPQDIILSTGVLHSVKDMVESAFGFFKYKLKWQGQGLQTTATDQDGRTVVAIKEEYYRPTDQRFFAGNNQLSKELLGFTELTPFTRWVGMMADSEYKKLL